jgi:predicted membrane protein (TIGR00267 family)
MLIIYARGSWVAGVTKSGVVVLAGLGASLAMGLSGFFGALLAEKAERERHLNDMEKATNNKVEDIHYEAEVCHGLRGARR